MPLDIVYDLSRLVTRVWNSTPNGIDRIDLLLARHFLGHAEFRSLALGLGFTGPRLLPTRLSRGATERVAAAWREHSPDAVGSRAYDDVVARLCGRGGAHRDSASRIVVPTPRRLLNVANALIRHAPPVGRSPVKSAPHGAIYVNATHFPLEWRRHVAWLDQRPDVRPVIWIHDLLAIERPGWFWGREPAQHQLRIKFLARRGAAAIVASASVEADLQRHLKRLGRHALPILRMTPPIQAVFAKATQSDPRLSEIAFFVVCGTIEPRKNHMLLLRVWRELIAIYGNAAPKLVVVGKRGWSSADIVAALEDQTLRGHVIEVAGLSTPDYKMLLDHCRALLAPSFAEGFGLPVAEALASGISVIASDIPPFREQVGESIRYLDPRSHESWRQAIIDFAFAPPRRADSSPVTGVEACRQTASLHTLDAFLRELPP